MRYASQSGRPYRNPRSFVAAGVPSAIPPSVPAVAIPIIVFERVMSIIRVRTVEGLEIGRGFQRSGESA